MQFFDNFLVFFIILGRIVISEGWLPVSVGLRAHHILVLVVVLFAEARLADGDIGADYALVPRIIYLHPLARFARKAARFIRFGRFFVFFDHTVHDLVKLEFCSLLVFSFFLFLCSPGFLVFLKDLDAFIAPISSAKWAIHRVSVAIIVLEAAD